jgi:hypothetical protein
MSGGGLTAGGARSGAALKARLTALFGTTSSGLLHLWAGEGIQLDGSNNVTGITALVGPNLTPAGTGSFVGARLNGRKAFTAASQSNKTLVSSALGGYCITVFAACGMPTLPFGTWQTVVRATGGTMSNFIVGYGGSSTIYVSGSLTAYTNGVATTAVTSATRTLIMSTASSTDNIITYGGDGAQIDRNWTAPVMVGGVIGSTISAANAKILSNVLRAYTRQ